MMQRSAHVFLGLAVHPDSFARDTPNQRDLIAGPGCTSEI